MNNTTTNIVVVLILVLLVGFGVWYFTAGGRAPAEDQGPGIELNIRGTGGDDSPGQGPGGN